MHDNKIQLSGIFSEGYGFVPKKLMKADDINSNAKLILCYLLSYTGAGVNCFPNIEQIANDLKISKRTIIRCIKSAREKGYLSIDKKHLGQGKGSSNLYTLIFMSDFPSAKNARAKKARESESIAGDKIDSLQVTQGNRNNNTPKINIFNNNKVILDKNLNTESFKNKYLEWVSYRKEIKKAMPLTTINKQLKSLSKHGESEAIRMIDFAIEKGWQGIYPIKGNENQKKESAKSSFQISDGEIRSRIT